MHTTVSEDAVTTSTLITCPTPTLNARLELERYTDAEHLNYKTKDYDPLSLDRPETINHIPEKVQVTDPIEGRAACHLAPAE